MPTYSTPIQPPTQVNYKQPFDIAAAPWNRTGFIGWGLTTSSSPFTAPTTYARHTVVDVASTITYGPEVTVINDTYTPDISGETTSYMSLDQRTMFLHPLTPDGTLGPLTDNTPAPTGATDWQLDPDDTPGGQWLGDYKVTISWRIVAGIQSRPGAGTIGDSSPSPLLPSVTANLRLLPASFFNETTGGTWTLINYRWPGAFDAASGTLLHSHVLTGGTNAFTPSIGGDFPAETFTIPAGNDTLALYTTCNQVESTVPPTSLYTHPPYYEDYFIARAFLAITRDLRPQRYQWIFADPEVSYPISEQRRSSGSAFLGRRR